MIDFCEDFTKVETIINRDRSPDFDNLVKVSQRKKPARPTLFEFALNDTLCKMLTLKSSGII